MLASMLGFYRELRPFLPSRFRPVSRNPAGVIKARPDACYLI